jgi:ABC-type nitrate/sulfonate/bicarbonate transport system permease component
MTIFPLLVTGGRRVLVTVSFLLLALLVIGGLWTVSVSAMHLDSFGTPTPLDVWDYWVGQPESPSNRALVLDAMWVTLRHALTGYAVGTVVGVLFAMLFVALPSVERVTLPTVLLVQTIPILAILPLFIMLFGRGILVTTIITGLTVFFPTLVWVSQGLRSPRSTTLDFFQSVAASPWTVMTRLRFPSAVAGVFVAARLAVPGAIFGAFVSEWLATGDGLGYMVVISMQGVGGYSPLWATVAVTTLMTMALYVIVEIVESIALAYYAPERLVRRSS